MDNNYFYLLKFFRILQTVRNLLKPYLPATVAQPGILFGRGQSLTSSEFNL